MKLLDKMDKTVGTLEIRSKASGPDEKERNQNEFLLKKDLVEDKLQTIVSEIKENILEIQKLQTSQSFEDDILSIRTDMQNKMNNFEIKWTEELNKLKEASRAHDYEEHNKKLSSDINEHLQGMQSFGRGDAEKMTDFSKENSTLKKRVREMITDGNNLIREIPKFEDRIVFCISKLESSQKELEKSDKEIKDRLSLNEKYLSKVSDWSRLSKFVARQILLWSSKMTNLCLASSSPDLKTIISKAEALRKEMKSFVLEKSQLHDEISSETKSLAQRIFGEDNFENVKELEGDIVENFKTIESYMERLDSLKTELINKQEEAEKTLRMKEEADKLTAAARAEAARIEAEKKEIIKRSAESNTQTEVEPPPRPPSPELEPRSVAPIFSSGLSDTVITEGVSCCLMAEVSGVPLPKITWFKDGIPVDSNTDYISRFQSGTCSLTIEETMKEDSANWSVRASNKAGYSESHAKLTVREVVPLVQEFPPLFVKPLADCEAKEGSSVELTAQIDGRPFPSVSWYRNGVCIDKSKNYNIGGENADCVLRIEKIYLEDSSTFTCKLQNSHGAAVSGAKLTVTPLEPVVAPQFELPLSNIVTKAGGEIVLECSITGTPTPSITWFKDNKAIKPSKDVEILFDGKNAQLRVKEAFPKHAGHYVCKGHNTVGETTSNSTVYFKSNTPELSDGETSQERERAKPAFYVPLSNSEATEAEDVVLSCVVVARPEAEVSWYHNNNVIKQTANIKIYNEENCHKLCLKHLELSQGGNYHVVARNSEGESSSSCHLQVKNGKTSSSCQTQPSTRAVVPKFTSPVEGQMVSEGESVVLEASLSGSPRPRITWYKGNDQLCSTDNIKIEVLNNKTSLTITKVTCVVPVSQTDGCVLQSSKQDGGQYRCRADNEAGTAESLADLIVKRETSAPVFLKRLTSQYLTPGKRLVMEVEVGGSPIPEICWYFNEKEVRPGKSVLMRRQGAFATLIINSVQVGDFMIQFVIHCCI